MLFDLSFPCYLTTFSGKKCLSGKVICAFCFPAYRSSPVVAFGVTIYSRTSISGTVLSGGFSVRSDFIYIQDVHRLAGFPYKREL
jgi:hypothetical protein